MTVYKRLARNGMISRVSCFQVILNVFTTAPPGFAMNLDNVGLSPMDEPVHQLPYKHAGPKRLAGPSLSSLTTFISESFCKRPIFALALPSAIISSTHQSPITLSTPDHRAAAVPDPTIETRRRQQTGFLEFSQPHYRPINTLWASN